MVNDYRKTEIVGRLKPVETAEQSAKLIAELNELYYQSAITKTKTQLVRDVVVNKLAALWSKGKWFVIAYVGLNVVLAIGLVLFGLEIGA